MNNSIDIFKQAQETRRRLQEEARSIGINEEYISLLVDSFYARVRQHPELGPVFEKAIGDAWAEHMPKMKAFWSSVVLRTGAYGGKPMVVHKALTDARPEHFAIWLTLFEETLRATSPNEQVTKAFLDGAKQMAVRLQAGMFASSNQ